MKLFLFLSILAFWSTTVVVEANVQDAVSVNTARIYHYKDGNTTPKKWKLSNAKLIGDEIDDTKYTVLYIHGHGESQESESVKTIVQAYYVKAEFNILVLDWEALGAVDSFEAGKNTIRISPFVAQAMIEMFDTKKVSVDRFRIVGHGMGAHIGGHSARILREKTDNKYRIRRVTGLDPAFYPFYPPIYRNIRRGDASFVDIIHTDAWGAGTPVSTGDVDFWPNEGRARQPGCKRNDDGRDGDSCSHRRSWRFWAESVSAGVDGSKTIFHSKKCSSWFRFALNACYDSSALGHMGLGANYNMKGDYYLHTNSRSPYSRGEAGTIYDKTYTIGFGRDHENSSGEKTSGENK